MKKISILSTLLFAVALGGCSHPQPVYIAPPPPVLDFQAIEQQGLHDGFEAARYDVSTQQPPVFNRHPRYLRPPVPPPGFQAYRVGFRRGYEQFLHTPPPPPPPPR